MLTPCVCASGKRVLQRTQTSVGPAMMKNVTTGTASSLEGTAMKPLMIAQKTEPRPYSPQVGAPEWAGSMDDM